MTGVIVNLRRARKAAARSEREAEAATARAKHGRPKGERAAEALEAARSDRRLDGSKLEPIQHGAIDPTDGA